MLLRFTFFIGIILFTISCQEENTGKCNGFCTEEFRSITVEITDTQENPVVLDSISITDITKERELEFNSEHQFEDGIYTIFNDNLVSSYKNQEIALLFRGYINDELIVEETYQVGADCCHVYHSSGPLKIVLD
ncbi:hypothetical protein DET49_13620 [Salegentibacter sp. 24]|uniref:hypothetical protein n=1 Tax=Salegentibacter sp. 24 TaxID=2183986 RepID=UPI00105BE004|nr:hypothetical protein [Salegentibacter sp. 24]TDN79658.1 hypothetical protein DET49_13620 [Salegentibacter sp. 24]